MEDRRKAARRMPATALEVANFREAGRHSIGGGLILAITPGGSRSWLARVRDGAGRRRDIGLGSYPDVSLREARERVADLRRQVRDGLDPVAEKRRARERIPTFMEAVELCHAERRSSFRNPKHAAQWITTLRAYADPFFGNLPIDQITGPMIVGALKPIWSAKPETAKRTLQRIATVIAWGVAHGYREHEAPLQAIRMGLPPQSRRKTNHAAIPYREAPNFMTALVNADHSLGRQALQLLILTATRSGEARGARWSEIDFDTRVWTVPADRIKMGRPHAIPLSSSATRLLSQLHKIRGAGDLIFQSYTGRALTDTALSKVMRETGSTATVHGWRSTFRDWGAEQTDFSNEVLEKSLAHQIPNAVERAYRRGDLLEKRRLLMQAWADFLEST